MSTPDPQALAVLLDAICAAYGYTRAEAKETENYARNIGAVSSLLSYTPLRGHHDPTLAYPAGTPFDEICPDCDAIRHHPHFSFCQIAAAWRELGDLRGGPMPAPPTAARDEFE